MYISINISLPMDLKRWLDQQVVQGNCGSASEYICDLLRRARERDALNKIDEMLVEAVESGTRKVMNTADWTSIRRAARSAAGRLQKPKR